MKLLIRCGVPPDGASKSQAGLKELHRSDRFCIEGDTDIRRFRDALGSSLFVGGRFLGVDSEAAKIVFQKGMEAGRETLEGRYFLVLVRPDGSCEVCTDRFGQQELYYEEDSEGLVLATDISLLPRRAQRHHQPALAHALCVYGWRPPKRHTFWEGARRLGIDQVLRVEGGRAHIRDIPFQPLKTGNYTEHHLNAYADSLLNAIRVRGSDHGNVVYLSSGWDSTAILACLVKLFGAGKVRAITGRIIYSDRSGIINRFETDRARAVADYYGIKLDIVDIDYRREGPDLLERLQPLMQAHQIGSISLLTQERFAAHVAATSNGDESVFAGEISDGAHNLGFSQFTTIFHPVHEFREYSDKMASYLFGPTFLGRLQDGTYFEDPVYQLLRSRLPDAAFDAPANGSRAGHTMHLLSSFFLRLRRFPLWSLSNSRVLTGDGRMAYLREMETTYLKRAAEEATVETLYSWYLWLYNSFHWQGSTVLSLYLTAEAQGLRMEMPFWDGRIQEFLSAMPESWGRGLDLNPTKYPLKWTLKHRVDYPFHLQRGPHSYIYDVQPGFSLVAEVLYDSAFSPYFRKILARRQYREVLSPEVFDLEHIDGIVHRYQEGTEVRGEELSELLALCQLSAAGWFASR